MKTTLALLCVLCGFLQAVDEGPRARPGFDWETVSRYAIQDRGRLKPFDTFARESVQFVTGKASWKGLQAPEVVFGWLIAFESEWDKEPFIKVTYKPLKKLLGLNEEISFFSPADLRANEALKTRIREISQKQRRGETLGDMDKKILNVQNQRLLVEATASGQTLSILPSRSGIDGSWLSLASLTDRTAGEQYTPEQIASVRAAMSGLLDSFGKSDASGWNQAAGQLATVLSTDLGSTGYPSASSLGWERAYNHLRPFRWSWVGYLLAFISLTAFLVSGKKPFQWVGIGSLVAGFLIHTFGFILRMVVSGRPPVTNMYESVIWVSWGCVLFSLLIGGSYKKAIIPAAASVFAIVALILADTLPSVLDPSIQPLEPVLRSNFWLTIHVLTITLSYAAFALSLCLGNVVLGHFVFRPAKTETIQYASLYMYRAIQIGVVLLAAGTILGGVWADYSWGRFWGWDPKEVWALIALLLYLAVLHGRFTGWLQGFGFATSAVMSFLGVLMAWYGVNFVLGAGLHSYGFGTGGTGYMVAYAVAQLAFVGVAYFRYSSSGARAKRAAIFPRN
jgi:cytochrome c-type biogenesis protein CcsB